MTQSLSCIGPNAISTNIINEIFTATYIDDIDQVVQCFDRGCSPEKEDSAIRNGERDLARFLVYRSRFFRSESRLDW